jgi:hypothetical protein
MTRKNNAANDPRLERYLETLEQSLKPLSVSSRAEIVTEIKSHVMSALDRDPAQSLDSVLNALGEAQTVANRYLLEQGRQPVKPPISPIVKWLVIGFLGTLTLVLLFAGAMAWRFWPLVKIDGKKEQVSLLGGLIDIADDFKDSNKFQFSGSHPILDAKATSLKIKFVSGKVKILNSDSQNFIWDCESTRMESSPKVENIAKELIFDLSVAPGINCKFSVPESTSVQIVGINGKIDLVEPTFNVDAQLANGKIGMTENADFQYRYDLKVSVGQIDDFVSSDLPDAKIIKVQLSNGVITRN